MSKRVPIPPPQLLGSPLKPKLPNCRKFCSAWPGVSVRTLIALTKSRKIKTARRLKTMMNAI